MSTKPLLVATLVIGVCTVLATAQQADRLPGLEERVVGIEAHIESVESVRAIKRLQYAYGHYVELGLWNDFADLFTDDAVTNYQQGARGRTQVRQLFFDQVGQGKLGLADGRIYPHILFQPVITLAPDGRTAKGRWRILAMLGGYGGSATWYSGVYENEYALENGVWKISLLHSEPKATAAYTAVGWKDSGARVPPHYTAASVASSITGAAIRADAATASLASLANRANQLAVRAARLNDQAAVTNVLDTYGYAMDRKQWDQAAGLFASDGTMELGLQGVYVGKASIRRGLNRFGPQGLRQGEVNDHVYLQTLVSVTPDGLTAKTRGVELILSSEAGGELSEGVFEDMFIKQSGTWKIQSVHFYPRMIVDALTGWAKSAKPAPGPSKEFPPDRPPSASYEIYPKFAVAPFHFDNPATGKPPQYPDGVQPLAKPAAAKPGSTKGAAVREADLDAALSEIERSLATAEAYDIAEHLIDAYGYSLDDSRAADGAFIFVNQILQPVIDVALDGKSAKIRARTLSLGGTSGGPGYWTAGTLEGQIVVEGGAWKFERPRAASTWSAPYPGGWAQK
jgi:hypothetical protein